MPPASARRTARRSRPAASSPTDALSARSAEPLYAQLAQRLAGRIARGELPPGAQLPTEAALQAAFGVSRVTVRQALAMLARGGQVVAQRGKGTFVARPRLEHDLGLVQGFQEALRRQGVEPQTELLEFSPTAGATDPERPARLDLPVRLRRLYVIDGEPFAVVQAYLPAAAAALGEARARRLVVYDILQQFLGLRIGRTEVAVHCSRPGREVAHELRLKAGTPVLTMHRTSYTTAGAPCEHMQIAIVPERYSFRLTVPGPLEIARALVSLQNEHPRHAGRAAAVRRPTPLSGVRR